MRIFKLLIIFFMMMSFSLSSFGQEDWNTKIRRLCMSVDGLDSVAKELRAVYLQQGAMEDLGYQAKGLKISLDQLLENYANNACLALFDTSFGYRFHYDSNLTTEYDIPVSDAYPVAKLKAPIAYRMWEYLQCDVPYDEVCEYKKEVKAPKGYQVCSISYHRGTRFGDYDEPKKEPIFFEDDDESPAKLKGYKITLVARGNKNLTQPKPAKIKIKDVILYLLPDTYSNLDRINYGCKMPSNGKSSSKEVIFKKEGQENLPDEMDKKDY